MADRNAVATLTIISQLKFAVRPKKFSQQTKSAQECLCVFQTVTTEIKEYTFLNVVKT